MGFRPSGTLFPPSKKSPVFTCPSKSDCTRPVPTLPGRYTVLPRTYEGTLLYLISCRLVRDTFPGVGLRGAVRALLLLALLQQRPRLLKPLFQSSVEAHYLPVHALFQQRQVNSLEFFGPLLNLVLRLFGGLLCGPFLPLWAPWSTTAMHLRCPPSVGVFPPPGPPWSAEIFQEYL